MTKILREKFKMEVISPSVRVSKNGIDAEVDVLAYANSKINEVYVVEVKSHLREEAIYAHNTLMDNFRALFPEHADDAVWHYRGGGYVGNAEKTGVGSGVLCGADSG
jgi:hypothetical protein